MWLPQGGALKIGNLQFTQYSIIISMVYFIISAVALIRGLMLKKHGGPNLCLKSV